MGKYNVNISRFDKEDKKCSNIDVCVETDDVRFLQNVLNKLEDVLNQGQNPEKDPYIFVDIY